MTQRNGSVPHSVQSFIPRMVFATRAHARLLEALGWQRTAAPGLDAESHAPLQCCFLLRDGGREEAAFGYTAVTMPDDATCPTLNRAKSYVEWFLARLGEDSGTLIQNTPLIAFGGRRRERVVVFGGWRFQHGHWTPFLLGPDGLAGAVSHDLLFARGTAPHHMAEICGHDFERVMPRIVELVWDIEALDQGKTGNAAPDVRDLQIEQNEGGWFTVRSGLLDSSAVSMFGHANVSPLRQTKDAAPNNDAVGVFDGDEFRFREFGMDRA